MGDETAVRKSFPFWLSAYQVKEKNLFSMSITDARTVSRLHERDQVSVDTTLHCNLFNV
jgi:hypothetical protein